MRFLENITPREYQTKILESCKQKNCLVVLPTGLGKTLIALMLSIERLEKFAGEKVLFLAPTKPLVDQHLKYFKKHLPELFAEIEMFTGEIDASKRKKIWQTADIIFSTPQCIANDLRKNLYSLENVSLLIEDEAHRCMKNYDYNSIAKEYQKMALHPRILGLTASPGSNEETIRTICKNLSIEEVEIRTRQSEDVKEYLQDLQMKTIKVEFPDKFEDVRKLLKGLLERKIQELRNRKVFFGNANKITLLECQSRIIKSISSGSKNMNLYAGASACAQAIKLHHAIELLETQTLYSLNNYFDKMIEEANKGKSKAVQHLTSSSEFNKARIIIQEMLAKNLEHPKLLELKDLIENKLKENSKIRIIVFSQYRDNGIKICKELNLIHGIKAKSFVGQTKKLGSGLSQKEQKKIIEDFSEGKFNILCATSIGEEGLDIPEVNAVIFYEPVPSAIRKIQRGGRTARLMPGEIITLVTKNTKDETSYWSAHHKEKSMHKAISSLKESLNSEFKNRIKEKQKTL